MSPTMPISYNRYKYAGYLLWGLVIILTITNFYIAITTTRLGWQPITMLGLLLITFVMASIASYKRAVVRQAFFLRLTTYSMSIYEQAAQPLREVFDVLELRAHKNQGINNDDAVWIHEKLSGILAYFLEQGKKQEAKVIELDIASIPKPSDFAALLSFMSKLTVTSLLITIAICENMVEFDQAKWQYS